MKRVVEVAAWGGYDKPMEFTACDICGKDFLTRSAVNSDGVLAMMAVLRGEGKAYDDICESCGKALVETLLKLEGRPPNLYEATGTDGLEECDICGQSFTPSDELGDFITGIRTEHRADYPEWKHSVGIRDIRSICGNCGKSIFEHLQALRLKAASLVGGKKCEKR